MRYKKLTHICTACPDYPTCNFNRELVYIHGFQHRYTCMVKTIPNIKDNLIPLDNAIRTKFIPALFNGYICHDTERLRILFALPLTFGGLGILLAT